MKAFILAAGKGERMRPLTDNCPKPLLKVAGKTLLDHQIDKLLAAGIQELVINTAYLGEMIHTHIAQQNRRDVRVQFSPEPEPLETGGALSRALAMLGHEPFLLVNGDVWIDCDYQKVIEQACTQAQTMENHLGHLVFVPNPSFKSHGDFCLSKQRVLPFTPKLPSYTFSGVSVLSPELISEYPKRREIFALKEVFDWAIAKGALSGQLHEGFWLDVGTPERLEILRGRM